MRSFATYVCNGLPHTYVMIGYIRMLLLSGCLSRNSCLYFSSLPMRPTALPAVAPATLPAMPPARPAIWFTLRP